MRPRIAVLLSSSCVNLYRQSKEEFDNLSKREMEELEEVLRSSEEERRRLEEERIREQKLVSRALAYPEGVSLRKYSSVYR